MAGWKMLKIFSLFIFPFLRVYADFELNIMPAGSVHSRDLNTSIVFSCDVVGVDENIENVEVKWIGPNNEEITQKPREKRFQERKYVEDDNGRLKKLYIKLIEMSDAGKYTCSATLNGNKQDKSIDFKVYKEITFDTAKSPQHPAIYTDAIVVCKVSGMPMPEVSWRYRNKRLDSEIMLKGRHENVPEGLLIRNITREDDGVYVCSADVESDGRFSFREIKVEVHVPPTMTEGLGSTEGVQGEEAAISCKADGIPAPEFKFSREGNVLVSNERITVNSKAGVVTFKPLSKDDEGNYTCESYNDVGIKTADGSVRVLVKPEIYLFENKTQMVGQPVFLECTTRGDPNPEFVFSKTGRDKPFDLGDNDGERVTVMANGVGVMRLTIKKLVPEDSGSYICTATNDIGQYTALAYLYVTYKPRFAENQTDSMYVWAGKTKNISCEADSQPPPVIKWSRKGNPIEDNSTYQVFHSDKGSNLQITVKDVDQAWIYGNIMCQAENKYGTNEMNINLKRATVPDVPGGVEVKENLPNGFILQILSPSYDGGDDLIGYHIEYFEFNSNIDLVTLPNDTSTGIHPPYQTNGADLDEIGENLYKTDKLKPGTEYKLRVRGKNGVGSGKYSELVAKTEAIRQPYPIKVNSDLLGDAFSYTIEWEKPNSGGLPIKEYEFKYREKKVIDGQEEFSDWTTQFRINDEKEPLGSFLLGNLIPNSTYQLQIRAKNDIDWSNYSPTFEFHTREATEREYSQRVQSAMSNGTIIALILFVLFLLLVIIDLTCYVAAGRGLTHTLVNRSRARSKAAEKEKVMEEGENKNIEPDDNQKSVDNPIDVEEEYLKSADCDDDIKKPAIICEMIEDEMDKEDIKQVAA